MVIFRGGWIYGFLAIFSVSKGVQGENPPAFRENLL